MGLFSFPKNFENSSSKEFAESAYYNLKLWFEDKDSNHDNDYLLIMAYHQLGDAIQLKNKECF